MSRIDFCRRPLYAEQGQRVFNMKKRLLVLAHREELLLQARDKFRSIDPELKAKIEQASTHAAADAKVVIASVLGAVPAG